MSNVDFTTPKWLLSYYHAISFISIPMNLMGLYLLLFQNGKMGFFKYYLLCFQIICALLDVHLTLLMQPVPLYPLIAGYTMGILGTWFGMSFHWQVIIAVSIGIKELEFLAICFAKKHQGIARTLQKKRAAPRWLEAVAYTGVVVTSVLVVVWPQFLRLPKDEQFKFIEAYYPEYLENFKALQVFDIYENSTVMKITFSVTLFEGVCIIFTFFIFITDIFIMMSELKLRISSSTYQKHREAVQSLLVQLATSVICLGPPCVFLLSQKSCFAGSAAIPYAT